MSHYERFDEDVKHQHDNEENEVPKNPSKLNYNSSLISTISSGMGNGALIMPYIFSQLGFVFGFIMLLGSRYLVTDSWQTMIAGISKCEDKYKPINNPSFTLIDAMGQPERSSGQWKLACQIASYLFLFCSSASYFLFIKNQLRFFFASIETNGGPNGQIFLALLFYPIFLLQIKENDIDNIKQLLTIGVIACLIVNIFSLLFSISSIIENGKNPTATLLPNPSVFTMMRVIGCFGAVLFCYDINGTITEIRQEYDPKAVDDQSKSQVNKEIKENRENNDNRKFEQVIEKYTWLMFGLMAVTGFFGFLAFGVNNTESIIYTMQKAGLNDMLATFLKFLLAIGLFSSVILYCYPIKQLLEQIVEKQILLDKQSFLSQIIFGDKEKLTNQTKQIIYSVSFSLLYFLITVSSIFFQSAVQAFNIQGCIFSVFLGFVCPYIVYKNNNNDSVDGIQTFVLIVGIVGGFLGLIATFS